MSLNVLIIPEDFRNDQYVLKPVISSLFTTIGKPRARVQVCLDPLLGGIGEAMKWENLSEIIDMYPQVDLFLLLVDRDGNADRRNALNSIERNATSKLPGHRAFFGEHAWQEIEVWALAGQNLPENWNWREIRDEQHPKEVYFEPFAKIRNLTHEPGAGRTTLGREAGRNYSRVQSRCPEDIQALESRLSVWLATRS